LPGLDGGGIARFRAGRDAFTRLLGVADGLGPVFNDAFCANCHDAPPAIGGTNQRLETRFGKALADGGFDPLAALGGPLLHDHGIGAVAGHTFAGETVPAAADVIARRRTQPLFGLGLVDATPDATFRAVAAWQAAHAPEVAGRAATVTELATGRPAVGRFGWKAAVPTLAQFAGDAALNEMGLTSPLFPDEVCPGGDCGALAFDPRPGLNDDGALVGAFADFMRLLGPPPAPALAPGLSDDASRGRDLFAAAGCANCHLPLLVTGPSDDPAFDRVAYHPYSDFLLHEMGALGDGIAQGDAARGEMRTQPLWGLSRQSQLLHDGRAVEAGAAILQHDGQGAPARERFRALSDGDRSALLAFLASL
jgi:CxxC motif-containing protein (DUF1111 family)